jgi:hypothetical protein
MLELVMAPRSRCQIPSVLLYDSDYLAGRHAVQRHRPSWSHRNTYKYYVPSGAQGEGGEASGQVD